MKKVMEVLNRRIDSGKEVVVRPEGLIFVLSLTAPCAPIVLVSAIVIALLLVIVTAAK